MRIAGCFLEYNDKFVILLRRSHKPDGNTWGLPGGKVEPGEEDQAAVIRELAEETGYIAKPAELEHVVEYVFISSWGQQGIYTAYRVRLSRHHEVRLEQNAHAAFRWVTPEECYARPDLITGFHELLRLAA